MTQQLILQTVQSRLNALQSALEDVVKMHNWAAGVSAGDLEGTPANFNANDAVAILSACADANALASYWFNGLPPSTYPQPASSYVYGASSNQVVGP
jgi:hypothetical protein